jgi:hypothetical protein
VYFDQIENKLKCSEDGGAYVDCVTPAYTPGSDGWTDDGTVVRLTTSTDNVGIGTTDPQYELDVANGSISANSGYFGNLYTQSGYSTIAVINDLGMTANIFMGNYGIRDVNSEYGNSGQVLSSTGSATDWIDSPWVGTATSSLIPDTDATYDLGAMYYAWKDLYVGGYLYGANQGGMNIGSNMRFGSGITIKDSSDYTSIDPYNRILYASDGSTSVLTWAGGRALFNGATDDYTSALQVNGQIYSNTGISVGGLPDYGQLLWLNGGGTGTEAVARLNNIDGDAWFDATAGHYQGFRFGYNQSYWQWTVGIDHTDNDTLGFYQGAAQPYGSFALKLLQDGRVLINSATDDTTSALQVNGDVNITGDYLVNGVAIGGGWVGTATSDLDMSTYAIKFASGGLITDGSYTSIDPYNRQLIASDGSTAMANYSDVSNGLHILELSSAPSSPTEGATYYDTTDHKMYTYDGTTWQAHW